MSDEILKGVARNTGIMLVQQIVTWTSTFVLMMFLPRYLGPVEYGIVFLGMSVGAMFGIVVSYGGNYLVAKTVSRDPESTAQIIANGSAFRVVLWVFVSVASIIFCQVAGYEQRVRIVIYIFIFSLVWQGPSMVWYSAFQGREMMIHTSKAWIAEKVFVSIVGVSSLILGAKAITIAVVMVIGTLLNFFVLLRYRRAIAPALACVQWRGAWQQMKDGIPYFMFTAFSTIYYRISSVVLSKTAPQQVLGWFGGAMRFFEMMNFFPFIFTIAVYPVFSRLWMDAEDKYHVASLKSLEFILMFGMPFSLIIAQSADGIIAFFYGREQYGPAVPVLQVLAVGAVFLFLNMIIGTILLSSDRQKQQSIVTLVAIPISIILNLVLIPFTQQKMGNGAIGAAAATIVVEMTVMLALLRIAPRESFRGFRFSRFLKIASSTAGSGLCIFLLRWLGINWLVAALAGILVYVPLLRLSRGIEDEDWNLALNIVIYPQIIRVFGRIPWKKGSTSA